MARAFVVQFHSDASISERRLAGRVEHLRTGDSAHFASLEDLLRFLEAHIETDREASLRNPQVKEYQK